VQPGSGATGDTVANLAVVKDPALATRCAQQLFRADRNNPTNTRVRQLTPQILMTPIVPAHTAGGAIVDGTYDIWGSVGRIVYSGGAGNLADAESLQRSLAAAAAEFAR
jgi:hypothetical protein